MKYMKDKRKPRNAILDTFSKSPSNTESFSKHQNSLDFFNKITETK